MHASDIRVITDEPGGAVGSDGAESPAHWLSRNKEALKHMTVEKLSAPVLTRQIPATRIVASTVGVMAGLLSIEHGYFETLQGHAVPGSIVIQAIGPPCEGNAMWHGCEPAMTIIPDFFITGILAIVIGVIVVVWAALFVERKHGGAVLIALSIVLLFVGGGFTSMGYGVIAGAVGTRINAPSTWWRAHLSGDARRLLAGAWPWSFVAFLLFWVTEVPFGYFFNDVLLNLSVVTALLGLGLPILTVFTGFAYDLRRTGVDVKL